MLSGGKGPSRASTLPVKAASSPSPVSRHSLASCQAASSTSLLGDAISIRETKPFQSAALGLPSASKPPSPSTNLERHLGTQRVSKVKAFPVQQT